MARESLFVIYRGTKDETPSVASGGFERSELISGTYGRFWKRWSINR